MRVIKSGRGVFCPLTKKWLTWSEIDHAAIEASKKAASESSQKETDQ